MTWPNEEEAITFMGWWSEDEKTDCPEPWETFTVMVHGKEAGDMRNATVEDLRLAGFVPANESRFTLEEFEDALSDELQAAHANLPGYENIHWAEQQKLIEFVFIRLQDSRKGGASG